MTAWTRADSKIHTFELEGLEGITTVAGGAVAGFVGLHSSMRTAHVLNPTGLGDPVPSFADLPLQSATQWNGVPYTTAARRLFRGEPGSLEMIGPLFSPSGESLIPDFVTASRSALLMHATNGGFYAIEKDEACARTPQPRITPGGFVSAAGYGFADTASSAQVVTMFGSGLGPADGYEMLLDGTERIGPQPEPYPNFFLGVLSRGNLAGIPLPVVYSNPTQISVQVPDQFGSSGEWLLFSEWNGLVVTYPRSIKVQPATPGIFVAGAGVDGQAAALNEDYSVNSATNPAPADSVLQIFATGLGGTKPKPTTGAFNSLTELMYTRNSVAAKIGGKDATVAFSGGAPGLIGGAYQVNVIVPRDLPPGAQPVEIEVAGYSTRAHQNVVVYTK